jgi:hypothetical protein
LKTKTTVILTEKELAKAITEGTFTGHKIKSLVWEYKNVMTDAGRGSATYEKRIAGVTLELQVDK